MGTYNYSSGEYIDLTYDVDTSFFYTSEYLNDLRDSLGLEPDAEIPEDVLYEQINQEIYWYQEDAWNHAEKVLANYRFYYFSLSLESGYYSGMQLLISTEFGDVLDSEDEKEDIYEEISTIGHVLTELADSGWRSSSGFESTCEDIADALQEMVRDVEALEVYDCDEPGELDPDDYDEE